MWCDWLNPRCCVRSNASGTGMTTPSLAEGDIAEVDFTSGAVRNKTTGKALKAKVLPAKLLDLLQAGGIYPLLELKGIIEPQT